LALEEVIADGEGGAFDLYHGALLNRFWPFNCRARAIDHLFYECNGGFWRWVTRGRGNVLSIDVRLDASRLLGLGAKRLLRLRQP
jgi:hypothetical protein